MSSIPLPAPRFSGNVSVEQALLQRRSTRQFSPEPLFLEQVSQLLWAAQGITSETGLRTAPSAGAICPLELSLVVRRVESLAPGIYKYCPNGNQLSLVKEGAYWEALAEVSFNQSCVTDGAAIIAFSATFEAMTAKYGAVSERFIDMEVGHASQNVHLQAVGLGLGTVVVAALRDREVREILHLPENEKPIYLMPVGKPAQG